MTFSEFFSRQARKPSGIFGRFFMSFLLDKGNAFLNRFTCECIKPDQGEHLLDIGCGTGKLVFDMAHEISDGLVEGIDFSSSMISVSQKKNRRHIKKGKVRILEGDFNTFPFEENSFHKICSVNTIYFWSEPEQTAQKIARILKPGGIFIAAFEDIQQLSRRGLSRNIFHFSTSDEVRSLLARSGFSAGVSIQSRENRNSLYHCVSGTKPND